MTKQNSNNFVKYIYIEYKYHDKDIIQFLFEALSMETEKATVRFI